MNEGRFEGVGGSQNLHALVAAAGETARRRRDLPRLQLAQRPLPVGRRAVRGAAAWRCYALDHRGRGKSDGERFYVDKFADYVHDLATFIKLVKSQEPGLPIFLLGHSAGGVISCGYALEYQDQLAGLICESFAHQVPAPDFALAVLKGVSHLAPHAHVFKLKNEDFSRDREVGRDAERRPADRARGAADEDGGRDGARRRAAEEGLPAHQAAAC